MPIKKLLKIAGLTLLGFFILCFVLMVVAAGLGKNTSSDLSGSAAFTGARTSYDVVSNETGAGTAGLPQAVAPLIKSGPLPAGEVAVDSSAATIDKKIIKTGSLDLKVEKTDAAAESITNIAKLNKGEIASSNFYESARGAKSGYLTVRVPYDNFDAAFSEIKKVATQVVSENSNAQDITAEYIDLAARLKNTQAEEASFVALLNRSGKIEEILAVTREVARVRGEIEQLQGQMRYLSSQTDMSTITVNLSEDAEIASVNQDWRPWQTFKTSVKQLLTNGQNFIDGLIAFLIVVLPMLLIYALIIWFIYFIGKKIYRHYVK